MVVGENLFGPSPSGNEAGAVSYSALGDGGGRGHTEGTHRSGCTVGDPAPGSEGSGRWRAGQADARKMVSADRAEDEICVCFRRRADGREKLGRGQGD